MAEKNNSNKIITITLAVIICLAVAVIIYVNLPTKEEKTSDQGESGGKTNNTQTNDSEKVLTIIYGDEQINYTMDEIKSMTPYTSVGAKINKKFTITGPYHYTGVKISTFLADFTDLPSKYSLVATSSDGYIQSYTYDQVQGTVELLNETRASLGNGSLTMIVAYMQENEEISDSEDGPLMIIFIDDYYTDSALWAKMVVSIEIVEE